MKRTARERETEKTFLLSEYGRQKLIGYADSFKEIARTLGEGGSEEKEGESRQSRLYNRKLWENRCMLADNLNEMAGVMAQVAAEVFSYRPFPGRLAKKITQALALEGLSVKNLFFVEKDENRTRISLTACTGCADGFRAAELADMLSVLTDVRLVPSLNCPNLVDGSRRSYTFVEEPKFVVMTGAARAVKELEPKSGDNYAVLESEKGKITLLLSDGMGSGVKACADSEMVIDLMEKLTEAGYGPVAAANLVNSALIAGGEEQNMSTLDICEVDLYDGICEFTKIGAASSFIKRDHMVEQITTGALPLGIFKGVESDTVRRRLMDGDYVFLLSDGIQDAIEACDYREDLCEIIGGLRQRNPKELAEALLQIVLRKTRGRIRDDMTILVMGIWES